MARRKWAFISIHQVDRKEHSPVNTNQLQGEGERHTGAALGCPWAQVWWKWQENLLGGWLGPPDCLLLCVE
jgi:hypothetical protein